MDDNNKIDTPVPKLKKQKAFNFKDITGQRELTPKELDKYFLDFVDVILEKIDNDDSDDSENENK